MSHRDKEPTGITVLKVIGALFLVLLALGFGALGACGAVFSVSSLLSAISRRGAAMDGTALIGVMFAVVGLGVAGLLIWATVTLFRKKEDRHE